MRRRIAAVIIALALVLFPLGGWLLVNRSFNLTMDHERERALSEEAAIVRAISLEIQDGTRETLYATASGVQQRYGSGHLRVLLVYYGQPMANAALPEIPGMDSLLAVSGRATLLDSTKQILCIAHRLTDALTLLVVSDVSEVYALRRELALWAGGLSLAGIALSAVLAVVLSQWLAKPYKQLARQRQDLIDAMAHEMRTPLTAILGGVRLLEGTGVTSEQRIRLLTMMDQETRRLTSMDERLLLLTQLDHQRPVLARFASMNMARDALSVFENVMLDGEDTVFIGERELLIELMRNLVVNAQRAGGTGPVRVHMLKSGFTVADQGRGMTKAEAARAFEPFYRADKSRARAAGGAGLGLTLCAKIANLHQGTLQIDSAPGQGTTVTFTMKG